jgi:hypothetical protein
MSAQLGGITFLPPYILKPLLLAFFPDGRKPHSRRLSLHFDNCRVERSKASENFFVENSLVRVRHVPDSSDLAPSDFWLFGHMKAALVGQQFPGPEDLLTGTQEFLSEIQRSELEFVFHHWMEQVRWVVHNNKEYFHEQTFDDDRPLQFCPDRPVATPYRPSENFVAGLQWVSLISLESHSELPQALGDLTGY